jgi:Rps23 Pro-64 3,4-dihydroxylase Tpa1-like proline 4-hydroxylase
MPRHQILNDFLPAKEHAQLLDFALAHQSGFTPATVYEEGAQVVTQSHRSAEKLKGGLGPLKETFLAHVRECLPEIFTQTGVPPKPVVRFETEVVAHGEGGRFGRHIDTLTGASRKDDDSPGVRTVSGVYYFYREPKAFSGGELRLYAFGSDDHVDITPQQNSLVMFPSFAAHEVLPVSCATGDFADSRFSVNCWLHCEV